MREPAGRRQPRALLALRFSLARTARALGGVKGGVGAKCGRAWSRERDSALREREARSRDSAHSQDRIPMRLTLTLTALAAAGASQLLILGPHHSGTSLTARALHEMGIFLGDADDLLLDGSNPNKFWERRDVVRANQKRMRAGVPPNATNPHAPRLPPFVGFGFEPGFGTPIGQDEAARAALAKLVASGQPWATKDPRLSLLASEWLPLLKADAVCVITVRHPLDFASSMLAYAPEVGLGGWSGIWLHYMASALQACALQPLVLIDHGQLIREPARALEALRARLLHLGVPLPKAAAAAAEASTPPPAKPPAAEAPSTRPPSWRGFTWTIRHRERSGLPLSWRYCLRPRPS